MPCHVKAVQIALEAGCRKYSRASSVWQDWFTTLPKDFGVFSMIFITINKKYQILFLFVKRNAIYFSLIGKCKIVLLLLGGAFMALHTIPEIQQIVFDLVQRYSLPPSGTAYDFLMCGKASCIVESIIQKCSSISGLPTAPAACGYKRTGLRIIRSPGFFCRFTQSRPTPRKPQPPTAL